MKTQTALFLNNLNKQFYGACASSFSDTRAHPWQGWETCLHLVREEFDMLSLTNASTCDEVFASDGMSASDEAVASNKAVVTGENPLVVLDMAAGNLRFEAYLANELGEKAFCAYAVDACEALAKSGAQAFGLPVSFDMGKPSVSGASQASAIPSVQNTPQTSATSPARCMPLACGTSSAHALMTAGSILYINRDIVEQLLTGNRFGFSDCDLAVSFGFMHHIPSFDARVSFLKELCSSVRTGGLVVVSLWRLLSDARLAKKAHKTYEHAREQFAEKVDWDSLERGDCLLGWQEEGAVYRYVHHFYDDEIDALIASVSDSAQLISRFLADGRSGDLNEYLIFRVIL